MPLSKTKELSLANFLSSETLNISIEALVIFLNKELWKRVHRILCDALESDFLPTWKLTINMTLVNGITEWNKNG